MYPVSSRFLHAIRYSHRMVAYATFHLADGQRIAANIVGGTVSIDRTVQVRRSCQLDIVLTDKASHIIDRLKTISPYTTRVQVSRGIRYTDGVEETVPLGWFWIDDLAWNSDETGVSLTCSDQSAVVAAGFMPFRRLVTSTSTLSLMSALIAETYSPNWNDLTAEDNLIVHPDVPDLTIPYPIWIEGDRWALITGLAGSLGADVWADMDSPNFQVTPYPLLDGQAPVFNVNAGEAGVLVDYNRTLSRSSVFNSVVARAENVPTPAYSVYGIAEDTNPDSPTYVGTYGRAVTTIEDNLLNTFAKCEAAAAGRLANTLGLASTLDLTTVPNPALDAGDCIQVVYPSGQYELHLIDALSIPLDEDGNFTIKTRATEVRL